jgi:hypothetical protein
MDVAAVRHEHAEDAAEGDEVAEDDEHGARIVSESFKRLRNDQRWQSAPFQG